MTNNNSKQKKRITLNYIYATLIGLLVIACAVTIALVSSRGVEQSDINVNPSDDVQVSAPVYTVPLANATILKDYSSKELQYNDTLKQWQIHKAIDLFSDESLNVLAITDGTVTNVYTNYLEGGVVEISHSDGLVSIYKSLSDVRVKVGDVVTSGQVIGTASDSMAEELNTGAHLHLEMKLNGVTVDPNEYITLANK